MSGDSLESLLKKHFGHGAFRKPQREVVASILEGRDTLAIMPTGGGKSLCYQLPALLKDGVTLVVSPLIALMKDQVDALCARGVAAAMINSSQSWDEQKLALDRMKSGELKLAYIAPERFRAHSFLRALAGVKVSLFAVDEAHCISQWGHDFRPDYMRLNEALDMVGRPPCAAFTATATPEVKADILSQLKLREPAVFVSGFARENLSFHIRTVEKKAQKQSRIRQIIDTHKTGIVYCATRKTAEQVSDDLRHDKVRHVLYHGGMTPEQRDRAQEQFMNGDYPVAVATNAFGMGIDRSDIRFVCHYEMPGSVEAFYQEAGRAGRDGLPAHCEVLFMYADKRVQDFFIDGANPDLTLIRRVYDVLRQNAGHDNEVFMTTDDIAEMAAPDRRASAANGMAVSSVISLLRRQGLIERFDIPNKRVRGTRLLQPDMAGRDIHFPPGALEQKRTRDESKLKAVIQFAYTKSCRQSWILDYFGEADAEPCDKCDRCARRGVTAAVVETLSEEEATEVRKALSGIARLSYYAGPRRWAARFGRDKILKSLMGSKDEKIIVARLHELTTHGILKAHGKPFVSALLRAMEDGGLVAVDDGEYPVMGLTDAGVAAMLDGGDIRMEYPRELSKLAVVAKKKSPKKQEKADFDPDEELDDDDEALFNKLSAKRNQLRFLRGNVPAYAIFPNSVLRQLAVLKPRTAEEAMGIKGIGEKKAKTLLPSFLKIIASFGDEL